MSETNIAHGLRVALPSDDGVTIAGHTGRAGGFLIYDCSGEKVEKIAFRKRTDQIPHLLHTQDGEHDHHAGHDHGSMIALMADCSILLCHGAGPRLVNDLLPRGIQVLFCDEQDAERGVQLLAKSELTLHTKSQCDHHHDHA